MTITLDAIRSCLEGAIPATIATCAENGAPNVSYVSQVHFVNHSHIALSFQFFNKTHENILANPYAMVQVVDPVTASHYQLTVHYLRTETEGPLFEHMKAKLAGIASHTGMSKVFHLRGADLYRVLSIEGVLGDASHNLAPRRSLLSAARVAAQQMMECCDLTQLLDQFLVDLERLFDIRHAMLLMLDERGESLYTVGSRGYEQSGVGSEVRLGEGVIGVAARERVPIRIGHMANEYIYSRAVRQGLEAGESGAALECEIPLPGLPESRSQLAVPIAIRQRLIGVLYVESAANMRFSYEDEDALVILASQLAQAITLVTSEEEGGERDVSPTLAANSVAGAPLAVRYYGVDHSIFINDGYLIKGVAGTILWKLLNDYQRTGRTEFSNRELRLDPAIRLPDICDNLETRLILLQRRLAERGDELVINKTGRGRFQLHVGTPLVLDEGRGSKK
jgi:adenylate cyclase